ncbi:sensor histidine kinase [Anaerosalibacter sp. Marseille-P3206]|uniref:sensor histidine kinase n=1 Tax=Anaerosalibacter sp. Marseille-P3206 TaxID=1871005 RepID=UPI0009854501|nr:HAMP domain-containing sensor histidine kinase [Anaerosalibacter sp. Marseille-P3206]
MFAFYWFSKGKLLRDILPITKAICDLPKGKEIKLEGNGELSYIQMALNDTSEKLKAQDSMRANWIAEVSHDIRTPLSLVLGYADQLSKSATLNEEEKKHLQKIISGSETIRSLIEDLNLTSRLEYNLTKIDNEPIDMVKLLRNIIVDFINQGDYEKYSFDFHIEPNNKFILKGNAGLLERAFRNLILNSIKHNPNGCDIYIHVVSYAKRMVITVKDNGKGCSEEKINALNKPTQIQIEKRKNQDSYHGLGLLIVKQVVELHNGEVMFYSGDTMGFQTEIHFPIQK